MDSRKKMQNIYITRLFTMYQLQSVSYGMLPKLIEMGTQIRDETLDSVLNYIERNTHGTPEQPELKKPKHEASELIKASRMMNMVFNEDLRNVIKKNNDLVFTIFWLVGDLLRLCKITLRTPNSTIQDYVDALLISMAVSSRTMMDLFNIFTREGCIKQVSMVAEIAGSFKENKSDDSIITTISGMIAKTSFKDFERLVIEKLPIIATLCTKTKSDANMWSILLTNIDEPNLFQNIIYYLEHKKVKMSTLCSMLSLGKMEEDKLQTKTEANLSGQTINHDNILYIATQVLDMTEFGNIDVTSFISFTGHQCNQHWNRIKSKKDQSNERGWLILYSLMDKDLSYEMFLGLIQIEEVRACKNYIKKQ